MMIDLALLVPRLVTGALLAGHGTQKLFGWFGGSLGQAHLGHRGRC